MGYADSGITKTLFGGPVDCLETVSLLVLERIEQDGTGMNLTMLLISKADVCPLAIDRPII